MCVDVWLCWNLHSKLVINLSQFIYILHLNCIVFVAILVVVDAVVLVVCVSLCVFVICPFPGSYNPLGDYALINAVIQGCTRVMV